MAGFKRQVNFQTGVLPAIFHWQWMPVEQSTTGRQKNSHNQIFSNPPDSRGKQDPQWALRPQREQ